MRILAECKHCRAQYDVSGMKPGEQARCRCGTMFAVPAPRAQDARVVRCAGCGAARGAGGNNCEFCGARFSAVDKGWGSMCPACFCRLPNDANFCVECGIGIHPAPLGAAAADLRCPRCACEMNPRMVDTVSLVECPACAGIWVGAETFETICKKRETQAIAVHGLGSKNGRIRFELSDAEKVKYVPCPVCAELMNRRNFAHLSGVIIDTCKSHGVWLDNQELNRIVKFIEAGGLDQAREKEAGDMAHNEKMREKRSGGKAAGALLPLDFEVGAANVGPTFNVAGIVLDIATLFLQS